MPRTILAARTLLLVLGASAVLPACSGDDDDGSGTLLPPGGPSPALRLISVDNGFGPLLPHVTEELDASGLPTGELIRLRTLEDVIQHVRPGSPILPTVVFPPAPLLPSGEGGNHYFAAHFNQPLEETEALVLASPTFDGRLGLYSVDPLDRARRMVPARVFVGGMTIASGGIERWVDVDPATGQLRALVPEAAGFPGVGTDLAGEAALASPNTVVVVADDDGDLSSFDTFPLSRSLRFEIPADLESAGGLLLEDRAVATTTVGEDLFSPEVMFDPLSFTPLVEPPNAAQDVDPATVLHVSFTESIQPYSVGSLMGQSFSAALEIVQGPSNLEIAFPFQATLESPYDLTTFVLTPAATFNGQSPSGNQPNTALADVRVLVPSGGILDFAGPSANSAQLATSWTFRVGVGPSLTNAPVVPESILAMRGGAVPGLSVIDLNGFGQSTGSPVLTGAVPLKGETHFPFNPNLQNAGTLRPLLSVGTSSIDGGSAGVFTLTLDSNLDDVLASAPALADASDAHLGWALDTVFTNAPPPLGCQAGGGNVCALDGLKVLVQTRFGGLPPGFPNLVSIAPHPNPPKLLFPPQCALPLLLGDEPTAITFGGSNLLVPGDPFGDPAQSIPPTGLLPCNAVTPFLGPTFGQTTSANCEPYGIRQQIGHFLYVVDRGRGEVVVLNSNRMTVVDRIGLPDPVGLAMGPNLDVLAVSNPSVNRVAFIDIDPNSSTFHTIIAQTAVGAGPRGLAFEPHGEDLLVCNELGSSVSVIDGSTLALRKTVASIVDAPFEVVVTPRMIDFAFARNVYFGYVVGRDGRVAVYESGPNGPGGWGYDAMVGALPFSFQAPRAIALDTRNLDASVYIAHEGPIDVATGQAGPLGVGAVSRVRLESALFGQVPLGSAPPNSRDLQFGIPLSLSEAAGQLSGIPIDLAFDELDNEGWRPGPVSPEGPSSAIQANSKASYRRIMGAAVPVTTPCYLFASVPDAGVIDVVQLNVTGTPLLDVCIHEDGVQSIEAPNVRGLAHYWRQ